MSARGRPRRSSPWSRRWRRWRSPAGSPSPPSPTSSRRPTSSSSPATRSAAPRLRGRRPRRAGLQLLVRPGPLDARGRWRAGASAGSSARRWRSGGRNAGRLSLAAVCGFAGIAYGALLNFSLMATYGGDLSLRALRRARGARGALRRRPRGRQRRLRADRRAGDGADAGPLPRALRVGQGERRRPSRAGPAGSARGLRGGGVAALLLARPASRRRRPAARQASDVSRAADWLVSVQNADGGFGASPGDDSGAEMTGWAMLGLEAAGRNPLDVSRSGHTPVDFLRGAVDELSSPGDLARTILALEGAGVDPRSFAGRNLVSDLLPSAAATTAPSKAGRTHRLRVIALRTAGATGGLDSRSPGCARSRTTTAAGATSRARPAPPTATGAVMQALSRGSKAVQPRPLLPAQGAAPRRRLPARRQRRRQLPVDRLGDPGHPRRRRRPRLLPPRRRQRPSTTSPPSRRATATTATPPSSDQTPIWVTGEVLVAAAGKTLPDRRPARAAASSPTPDELPEAAGSPRLESAPPVRTLDRLPRNRAPASGGRCPLRTFCASRPADLRGASQRPPPAGRRERRGSRPRPKPARVAAVRTGRPTSSSNSGRRIAAGLGLLGRRRRLGAASARAWLAAPALRLSAPRRGWAAILSADGRRDGDSHPPHPQGVRARAAAARGARGAARAGQLGAEPPPHRALALPRRRPRRRWRG